MQYALRFLFPIAAFVFFSSALHAEKDSPTWMLTQYAQVEEERILSAVVEAVHQATISAQTTGRVVKINADVDDTVAKGDILVQFRNKEQRSSFLVAKAKFEEAESEYKRIQDVYEKKLVAKAALDKALSQFKSKKAELAKANEALENTIVRAPYSGIVVKRHIEVGELARAGRELMTGLSLEKLRANVALPQDLVHVVRKQNKASAILKDGTRLAIKKITVSPFADAQSHTFQMRAELPKGDFAIYPGMFIKIAIVNAVKQRLVIPSSAIARRSEVNAVYVMDNENKLTFRHVRVGQYISALKSYEILAGLENNEKIMLDPIAAAAQLKLQE